MQCLNQDVLFSINLGKSSSFSLQFYFPSRVSSPLSWGFLLLRIKIWYIYIYIYIFFFSLAFCVIVFRLHFFSHARSNLFLLSSSLIFGQVFLLANGSTDVNLFLCHGIYLFKFKKHTHEKGGEVLIQIYIVHHKHHSNFLKFDSVYILNNSRNTIFFL